MKFSRNYNLSDALFLEYADVVGAGLPDDLAVFTAFDVTFTNEYVTQLLEAIATAKTIPSDEVLQARVSEETEHVKQALTDSYEDYKTLAYFVRKAFKDSPAVQKQFGSNEVQKAKKSQPKMILFMDSLAKTAAEYKETLVQSGCAATLIDGLAARADSLREANVAQERAKDNRRLQTQDRIQKLNQLYELLLPLEKAAHFVFSNDPQRLKTYSIPQPPKKAKETELPETE
ncbi:MAG: hypothetical protein JXR65_10345 [Bacteroidales bacterium]|nr:hypothetical protein [Bacteroidales bacterium]